VVVSILQRQPVVWGIGLLVTIILIPIIAIPFPPLLDYPNHLARLWLIAGGVDVAPLNRFYVEDWHGMATNIGIDVAAKLFGGIIPPFVLGTIMLAVAALLPPLGAVALNKAEFGGYHPWQLIFFFFWCPLTLLAGFLNFQIGLGAALFAAAADRGLRARGGYWLHAWRLIFGVGLTVIHPFALLFYCTLLAGLGFGPDFPRASVGDWGRKILHAEMAALICLVPLVLFFLWAHALPGGSDGSPPRPMIFSDLAARSRAMLSPFIAYNFIVDGAFILSFFGFVLFCAVRRKISCHAGLLIAAAAMMSLAPFMPTMTNESGWVNRRLPIMAVLAALAATRFNLGQSRRDALALGLGAVVFVVLRTADVGWNWSASFFMIDSLRSVLAEVPPGAMILPMRHEPPDELKFNIQQGRSFGWIDTTYIHYPALAIPWRHAFIPTLFGETGKQPVRFRAPYDQISDPRGGWLISVHALSHPELLPTAAQFNYIKQWRTQFDYVLVLNADEPDLYGSFDPPPGLRLVKDGGFAQLFRIQRNQSFRNAPVELRP